MNFKVDTISRDLQKMKYNYQNHAVVNFNVIHFLTTILIGAVNVR